MYRTNFWTLWERVRVGWYGRMALKPVNYHMWNESPVQVWCMIQDARGWCTGMTQRDGMGRELEGEFRMRNTCIPMADSSQCMAKPIQCCKVKKKKKKESNWLYVHMLYTFLFICFFHPPRIVKIHKMVLVLVLIYLESQLHLSECSGHDR